MPRLKQPTFFDQIGAPTFPTSVAVRDAIEELASTGGNEVRGAVFTRLEVVEFILDLAGFTSNKPLHRQRILEPSFGKGDFLLPVVDRVLASWKNDSGKVSTALTNLGDSIRGVELHKETFEATREVVIERLTREGMSFALADDLVALWLCQGDFLLEGQDALFDYVVGNPPYVRQELIPPALLAEYRSRFSTMYDRADLYVAFIERSLSLLGKRGKLGFICADRWMKNRYGGPLREFVSMDFYLHTYVDMTDTDAFHEDVSAYPAITIIAREQTTTTRVIHQPKIDKQTLASVASEILSIDLPPASLVKEVVGVVNRSEPWLLESPDQMALIRRLEGQYPIIEQTGCKVGIGVATGADKVFVGEFDSLDVEFDRKLPLATTSDIKSGEVQWLGKGVVNPFLDDGNLVDLKVYPRLSRYFEKQKELIEKRHCAQKTPGRWYRTIDRIWPHLATKPKLLIPDIKGEAHVVFEPGRLYPHHNLYYIVSDTWDLRALQAVLISGVARLFVTTYSTKMRGGYFRFQAQYLRRIRIPFWQDVSEHLRAELIQAGMARNLDACNHAVFALYGLNAEERSTLGGNGD